MAIEAQIPPATRRAAKRARSLLAVLSDDPYEFTVDQWHERNLELYDVLVGRRLIDPQVVPPEAHRYLTASLINADNPAAMDPQNSGHVRAQNENVVHYGLCLGVPKRCLTIALEAGFIHDLNKSVNEPLRRDRYAVRDERREIKPEMVTLAESVGLNHLGERTKKALEGATHLPRGALSREVMRALDLCIVHHGLGSSLFIQRLLDGRNEWWGAEFVDPQTGVRLIVHPPQPPLTLESTIHDLADSTQQMQGGVAWLQKYPFGFWKDSGRSYWEMISGTEAEATGDIPMSLLLQVEVETATCRGIVACARRDGLVDATGDRALEKAILLATRFSRAWADDSPAYLAKARGQSLYHHLAAALNITPEQAVAKAKAASPGSAKSRALEEHILASAKKVDARRSRDLSRRIERCTPRV